MTRFENSTAAFVRALAILLTLLLLASAPDLVDCGSEGRLDDMQQQQQQQSPLCSGGGSSSSWADPISVLDALGWEVDDDEVESMHKYVSRALAESASKMRARREAEEKDDASNAFFQALNQGNLDVGDERDRAAADLVRRLLDLHSTGDAYAPLDNGDDAFRTYGQLWRDFSRDAVEDFLSLSPKLFLLQSNWVHSSMFAAWPPTFVRELMLLQRSRDWDTWRDVIQDSQIGEPPLIDTSTLPPFDEASPLTTTNLVHQVFHLEVLGRVSGMHAHDASLIVEFGGGYGCLCHAIHRAGFRGRYVIYDLPVFSAVQEFFLRSNYLTVMDLSSPEGRAAFDQGSPAVYVVNDASVLHDAIAADQHPIAGQKQQQKEEEEEEEEELRQQRGAGITLDAKTGELADSDADNSRVDGGGMTLFIAMWSLTEAPASLRADFLSPLIAAGTFDALLVGTHRNWGGIDNDAFVRELGDSYAEAVGGASLRNITFPEEMSPSDRYFVAVADRRRPAGDYRGKDES